MKLKFNVKAEERVFYDFDFEMNFPDDMHGEDIEELSTEMAVEKLFENAPHEAKRVALEITEISS